MRTLSVFNQVSLDGFIADAHGDMSWAHRDDPQWRKFVAGNAKGKVAFLFGRRTWQMMAGHWSSPQAHADMPSVAEAMCAAPKYVFSRSLERADWENSTLLRSALVPAVRKLKAQRGPDLLILGSASLVGQLTEAGLIDQWQVVVCPIVLGAGRPLFDGLRRRTVLRLVGSRSFRDGNVVLRYERAGR